MNGKLIDGVLIIFSTQFKSLGQGGRQIACQPQSSKLAITIRASVGLHYLLTGTRIRFLCSCLQLGHCVFVNHSVLLTSITDLTNMTKQDGTIDLLPHQASGGMEAKVAPSYYLRHICSTLRPLT